MSDPGGFPAASPVAQGAAGPPNAAFLQSVNQIVQALNAQTQAIKGNTAAILAAIALATGKTASATGLVLGGYAHGVDLNALGDTRIAITSPSPGYMVDRIIVQGASGAQGGSAFGAYSAAAAGGFSWTGGQVASTLAAVVGDTVGGAQTIPGPGDVFSADPAVFFNVGTAQGAASTANVYIFLRPLP